MFDIDIYQRAKFHADVTFQKELITRALERLVAVRCSQLVAHVPMIAWGNVPTSRTAAAPRRRYPRRE
jgi:hypothetical protein